MAPNYTLRQQIMRKVRLMKPGDAVSFNASEIVEAFPPSEPPLPVKTTWQNFWELMPGSGYELEEQPNGICVRKK